MKQVVIRQSTVNDLELCPARVGLRNVDGYEKRLSEQLLFGDMIHETIFRLLTGESLDNVLFTDYQSFLEHVITTEFEFNGIPLEDGEALAMAQDSIAEVIRAITSWSKAIEPYKLEPLYLEQTFETQIAQYDDYEIILQGTPDCVTEDAVLWDWKTSGRGWKNGKAEASIQAPLYIRLLRSAADITIRQFNYFVYNRQKEEWVLHETYPSDQFIDSATARAIEYGRMVESEVFPATPLTYMYGKPSRGWYCSEQWCPAWNICPYKNLDEKGD